MYKKILYFMVFILHVFYLLFPALFVPHFIDNKLSVGLWEKFGKLVESHLLLDTDNIVTLCFDYSELDGVAVCTLVDENILTAYWSSLTFDD